MMQYYPVALRHRALNDILSGPSHMRANLATAMPAARALAADFPETVVHKDAGVPLRSRRGRAVFKNRNLKDLDNPTGIRLRWFTLSTLVSHWFHSPRAENLATPEVEFGKGDAHWWRLPVYDSALVSSADGSGKNIYMRDRRMFRRMLLDSVRLHRRLRRDWPRLAAEYRAAASELTSLSAWERTFEESR
jgi:galactofuranosylgalactofuranosylrhamnosyl-N-acetylglucosaminyl-diphospho-decaprenol beta-1,5/1,6-galactofuranosyltransferase